MPRHSASFHRRWVPLLFAASALACESPTDPTDSNVLRFGVATTGRLASGETKTFTLDVKAGQPFAVFVRGGEAGVSMRVQDGNGNFVGTDFAPAGDTATMLHGLAWTNVAADQRFTIAVVTVPVSSGGEFALRPVLIDLAPEHASRTITMGSLVTGERIDHLFDQDEFTLDVPATVDAEMYGQSDAPGGCIAASVVRTDGRVATDGQLCAPGSTDIESGASGRFALEPGRYTVRVGAGDSPPGTTYRFQVRAMNPAPEVATAQLTLGDTIAEAIDYVGDQDDFVLRGAPGAEFEVFVGAGGAAPHLVQVLLLGLDQVAGPWADATPGVPLLDTPTGRFTMPPSGQMTVRVRDVAHRGGLFRGPYRLVAVAIDRRPEGASDAIVPSAKVIDGALELYGDVDEFRFTLDTAKRMALRCAPTPAGGCGVYAAAVYRDDAPALPVNLESDVPLAAGAYRLRLDSGRGVGGVQGMYRGPYQVVLAPVDTVPEDVPSALTVGVTASETAAWPVDFDTFTLNLASADTVVVHLSVADSSGSRYRVGVMELSTGRTLGITADYDSPTEHRIDLASGAHAITVRAAMDGWRPGAHGNYQLGLQRISAAPEGRGAAVAYGDTVRSMLEYNGDIDDYLLTGTAWEMVSIVLKPEALDPFSNQDFYAVTSIDPANGTTLGRVWTAFAPTRGEPVEIPAGGVLKLRVCSLLGCPGQGRRDAYTFVIERANTAPELRAANFVVGDTVAETLELATDVDEFTFTGTAGQVVDIVGLQAPTSPYNAMGAILEVLDQVSGARIANISIRAADVQAGTAVLRGLVLPDAGRYTVRIRPEPSAQFDFPTGAYRFLIAPH